MIVYSADSSVQNWPDVLRNMFRGMISSRYIAYRLAVKDIKAEYGHSAFGILWDFVDPFVLGGIFYMLAKIRAINPGALTMPYAIYVVYGLLIYQCWSEAVALSVGIMHRSKTILTHLKVPPEALILSVGFRCLFNAMFRIVIMLVFSIIMYFQAENQGLHTLSLTGFPLFLLAFPLIIFSGVSIGILLAPFNAIYSDIGKIVTIILNPLRYLTPVLFVFPTVGKTAILYLVNPIAHLLNDLRLLATAGTVSHWQADIFWIGFHLVVFLVGWFIFHLAIPILAERS